MAMHELKTRHIEKARALMPDAAHFVQLKEIRGGIVMGGFHLAFDYQSEFKNWIAINKEKAFSHASGAN